MIFHHRKRDVVALRGGGDEVFHGSQDGVVEGCAGVAGMGDYRLAELLAAEKLAARICASVTPSV